MIRDLFDYTQLLFTKMHYGIVKTFVSCYYYEHFFLGLFISAITNTSFKYSSNGISTYLQSCV